MEIEAVGGIEAVEGNEVNELPEKVSGVEKREQWRGLVFSSPIFYHGLDPLTRSFVSGKELEPRDSGNVSII